MYWIAEHKAFVAVVALSIIAIALVYNFVAEPLRQDTLNQRNEQFKMRSDLENKVKTGAYLSDKSIRNAEDELKYVESRYQELKKRINYTPTPGYEIPEMKRPGDLIVNFQGLLKDVQKRLEQKSAETNIPIPAKLELAVQPNLPPAETLTLLTLYYEKLDVLEQLVNLAMDSRCRRIVSFGLSETDFKDFKDIRETVIKNNLAQKNLVLIKISGSYNSISRFISQILSAERFISIEKTVLENSNPDSDTINATFVVASVKLVADK